MPGCLFCHREVQISMELGRLYIKNKASMKAHYHCLVFSKNLHQHQKKKIGIQGFLISDINEELEASKNQMCMFCGRGNASIECCHVAGCKQNFHLPCGLENGAVHQYYDNFQSYCPAHRPHQEVLVSAVLPDHCCICLQGWSRKRKLKVKYDGRAERGDESEDVSADEQLGRYCAGRREDEVLWAPCCKFTKAFHSTCMQLLAGSSGYSFQCPDCRDDEVFPLAMKRLGIYVPKTDSKWTLERQAFDEMSQHTKIVCSAEHCKCVSGPDFNRKNTLWEMVKCSTCGYDGLHRACGGIALETALDNWQCSSCSIAVAPNDLLDEPISTRLSKVVTKGKQDMPSTSNIRSFKVTPKRRPGPKSSQMATPTTTIKTRASSTVVTETCVGDAACHGGSAQSSFPRAGFEPPSPSIDFINNLLSSAVFKVGMNGIKEICSHEFSFKAVCSEDNQNDEPWV